jgi:hypothetical protein
MAPDRDDDALRTLEPLIEAVQEGVETAGWALSGLQKTTSHRFEGRWEGEQTRSAYLVFHRLGDDDTVALDVYLDETSQGLRGNVALVLDGPRLGDARDLLPVMDALRRAADELLPREYRTPVSLRFRMDDAGDDPRRATSEIRIKIEIPGRAVRSGTSAVRALSSNAVKCFEELLDHPAIRDYLLTG